MLQKRYYVFFCCSWNDNSGFSAEWCKIKLLYTLKFFSHFSIKINKECHCQLTFICKEANELQTVYSMEEENAFNQLVAVCDPNEPE